MKALLIVLLAFASATAEAASLEETYLAARNQYIAKFKKLEVSALTGDGLLSVCLQHEVDQLDGIFWIYRLSRLKRDRVVKRFDRTQRTEAPGD